MCNLNICLSRWLYHLCNYRFLCKKMMNKFGKVHLSSLVIFINLKLNKFLFDVHDESIVNCRIWKPKPCCLYLRNRLSLWHVSVCKTNRRTSSLWPYKAKNCIIKTDGDIKKNGPCIFQFKFTKTEELFK